MGCWQARLLTYPALGCLLLCAPACDAVRLESAAGRYVVVHWDPRANSLCGGTLFHIDRTLENITNTYGAPLPEQPSIDIFWTDETAARDVCDVLACVSVNPNGTATLVTPIVIQDHELGHAVRFSRRPPDFFREGLAERWHVGPSDQSFGKEYYVGDLSESLLRNAISQKTLPLELYEEAAFFWAWLEATFGPKALVEFVSNIRHPANVDHVETVFKTTFGLSFAEAAEASRGQPLFMSDVHACSISHAPELIFDGTPLIISDGEAAECGDSDMVNIGAGAGRVIHVVLPEAATQYSLELSGPDSANVRLDRCVGTMRPYEEAVQRSPVVPLSSIWLAGKYAFTISAAIEPDGTVELPLVRLSAP